MRLVSPLLKRVVYPVLHGSGWLSRYGTKSKCAVVNYHGVIPSEHTTPDPFLDGNLVSTKVFHEQVRFLKTHYDVIDPEEFRLWIEEGQTLPRRAVLLTCDDGLLNTLTDMVPLLRSENVRCLFFVTAASCKQDPAVLWYEELYQILRNAEGKLSAVPLPDSGGNNSGTLQHRWWDAVQKLSRLDSATRLAWMHDVRHSFSCQNALQSERRWRLLRPEELLHLVEAGMDVGAHTITHPILSECSEDEARREIQQSKTDLERTLGRPIWAFAYPFGNPATMGEREVRLAREAGFVCAFLNVGGKLIDHSCAFSIPRTHITKNMTIAEFHAHMSGFHTRLQRAIRG